MDKRSFAEQYKTRQDLYRFLVELSPEHMSVLVSLSDLIKERNIIKKVKSEPIGKCYVVRLLCELVAGLEGSDERLDLLAVTSEDMRMIRFRDGEVTIEDNIRDRYNSFNINIDYNGLDDVIVVKKISSEKVL